MKKIGIVGLGAMGSAMAPRLIKAGYDVYGNDVRQTMMDELKANGGTPLPSARAVAEASDIFILSLPNEQSYHEVVSGQGGVTSSGKKGLVVACTCTMHLDDKARAREALEKAGMVMLDTTVSGTRPTVLDGTLAAYASGDEAAYKTLQPVFAAFTKSFDYLGEFGNASKMKYVINLMVAIQNATTAEALTLAVKSGLDPQLVHKIVGESFVACPIWKSRGGMMVSRDYTTSRGTLNMARKDSRIITQFAIDNQVPVPLFQTALQMHRAGVAQGRIANDAACVYEIYRGLAGLEVEPPQDPVP